MQLILLFVTFVIKISLDISPHATFPSLATHVWLISGASIPLKRILTSPNLIVSPSTTVTCEAKRLFVKKNIEEKK